jgi:hypothetical protein
MNCCAFCDVPVSGGRDTYGDLYYPICFDCHWGMFSGGDDFQDWYGVAPHVHDLSRTGSMIGSTVLMDISAQLSANGEYDCGGGVFFRPDPDATGLGVYSRR